MILRGVSFKIGCKVRSEVKDGKKQADRMKDFVLFVDHTPLILPRAGMPNGAGCTDTICVTGVILEKYLILVA